MLLLKMSLRPWRQAPWNQILSVVSMGALLTLSAVLYHLEQGLSPVVRKLQTEQVITAYLQPDVDPKQEDQITDAIRISLGARPNQVQKVGVEDFTQKLEQHYPELAREVKSFGNESHQLVPRHISIIGSFSEPTIEKISKIDGIESFETSKDRHAQILGGFRAIRWVARVLGVGLIIALISALVHMGQMNRNLHQDVVRVMRLWGSTIQHARMPGLMTGMGNGLLGGIIGAVFFVVCANWLFRQLASLSPLLSEFPEPGIGFIAAILLAGLTLGSISSGAVKK